jgi:hypothetical protein
LGVNRRSESQRSLRHVFATSPRSSTTWSMERSVRQRLMASPAWPAPITMVVVVRMIVVLPNALFKPAAGSVDTLSP